MKKTRAIKNFLEKALYEEVDIDDTWRASRMYFMCPRKIILNNLLGIHKDKIQPSNKLKMDFGTALHHHIQNQYYGPMGILETGDLGFWECKKCSFRTQGLMPNIPHSCFEDSEEIIVNENTYWEYIEPEFIDEKHGITGHCDGILNMYDNKYLLEIKTSGPFAFKNISEPYPSYIFQANIYMHYFGIDKCIIQYFDRGLIYEKDNVHTKEFMVFKDDFVYHKMISKISVYNEAIEHEILPMRIEACSNEGIDCKHAKYCPYSYECFKLENKEYSYDEVRDFFQEYIDEKIKNRETL